MDRKPVACLGGFGYQANVVGDRGHRLAGRPLHTRTECLLLGLAWHNTVVLDRQVVIKSAIIPSVNKLLGRNNERKEQKMDRLRRTEKKGTDKGSRG